jgi:hypothetical protein
MVIEKLVSTKRETRVREGTQEIDAAGAPESSAGTEFLDG